MIFRKKNTYSYVTHSEFKKNATKQNKTEIPYHLVFREKMLGKRYITVTSLGF